MKTTIRNGAKIPEFKAGERPGVWSAERLNQVVRAINSLLNPSIARGGLDSGRAIIISDYNYVIQIQSDD